MKKGLVIGMLAGGVLIVVVLVIKKSNVEQGAPNGDGSRQVEMESAYDDTSDVSIADSSAGSTELKSLEATVPAPNLYTEKKLSDPVKTLLGLDGEEHNYNSFGNAIGKLSKDLSVEDVAALRAMLTWPNDRFPEGMRDVEINAVKNDVLDRLLRQTELPEGIGLQLVEMASNPENDPVWRDYCVQFMTPYYERASGELATHEVRLAHKDSSEAAKSTKRHEEEISDQSASSEGELDAIRETMFIALNERDSTIAGTSLIGLELLSRTHEEFDREMIEKSALDIAVDESASVASRMTAMRLAAGLGPADNWERRATNFADYTDSMAETARLIAQTGETVLLRSAAIVTLGETGSEADRELLESYTLNEKQQIAAAARMALQKIDAPQQPEVDLSKPATVSNTTTTPQPEPKLPPVLIN